MPSPSYARKPAGKGVKVKCPLPSFSCLFTLLFMAHFTVLQHPLIDHKLSLLRAVETPPWLFRKTLLETAQLMSWSVFQHLQTESCQITTPLEEMQTRCLPTHAPAIVSILRAGNGMADALATILPEASIGHLGMERDAETHQARAYYAKLPPHIAARQVILVDPMLATGGSAIMAADKLRAEGVKDIVFVCLVAAPEGVEALQAAHPDMPVITAALDRQLDENCYILPGLGDAGDRIYNT